MSHRTIISAWRDHEVWLGLSEGQRARVPANPAGSVEQMDADLEFVVVGMTTISWLTCHTDTHVCCD